MYVNSIIYIFTNFWFVVVLCFLCYLPGILYKGNGENQFISQQPPVVSSIMGNGRRRSISCPSCNGQADGNKLLAPVALACGIDGSLYVGDFNYVRRIFPSGNVTSVLELRYGLFLTSDFWSCELPLHTEVRNRFLTLCKFELPNAFRNKKKKKKGNSKDFNPFEKVFKTEVKKFSPGKMFQLCKSKLCECNLAKVIILWM